MAGLWRGGALISMVGAGVILGGCSFCGTALAADGYTVGGSGWITSEILPNLAGDLEAATRDVRLGLSSIAGASSKRLALEGCLRSLAHAVPLGMLPEFCGLELDARAQVDARNQLGTSAPAKSSPAKWSAKSSRAGSSVKRSRPEEGSHRSPEPAAVRRSGSEGKPAHLAASAATGHGHRARTGEVRGAVAARASGTQGSRVAGSAGSSHRSRVKGVARAESKADASGGNSVDRAAGAASTAEANSAARAAEKAGAVAAYRYDGVELPTEPRHRAEVLRELPMVVAAVTGLLALLGVQMWLHRRRPLGTLAELPTKRARVTRKAGGDTQR